MIIKKQRIHSFIQNLFVKHLLCTEHITSHKEENKTEISGEALSWLTMKKAGTMEH